MAYKNRSSPGGGVEAGREQSCIVRAMQCHKFLREAAEAPEISAQPSMEHQGLSNPFLVSLFMRKDEPVGLT